MESLPNDCLTKTPYKRRRILCAEDHAQMAALLEKVLTKAGHQVVCVADGDEALDRFEHGTFDVVITDHHMPNISGLELVMRLRALGFNGKVLLHTSRLTAADDAAYRALEVEVLMKPGSILKLAEIVA